MVFNEIPNNDYDIWNPNPTGFSIDFQNRFLITFTRLLWFDRFGLNLITNHIPNYYATFPPIPVLAGISNTF